MNFNQELLELAQKIFDLANQKNIKIVSAESCTGGLLSALLTEISGASKIFDRGFVVYSNLAKEQNLGVNHKILNQFGAVSEEVCKEMAIGAIKNSDANLSIAITGISGPDGGSFEKPAGLVYIASFNNLNRRLLIKKFNFSGNRQTNRDLAVFHALEMLINQVTK